MPLLTFTYPLIKRDGNHVVSVLFCNLFTEKELDVVLHSADTGDAEVVH